MPTFINPGTLIFIGSSIAVVGAFWQYSEQSNYERMLREKSDKIAELSEKNSKLAEDAIKSVTGGDSYCELVFSTPSSSKAREDDVQKLMILHSGEHPLYDVNLRIVDVDKLSTTNKDATLDSFLEALKSAETIKYLGNIAPHSASDFGQLIMPNSGKLDLNLFFSARNGFFNQLIRMRKINGAWLSASKTYRNQPEISADGKTINMNDVILNQRAAVGFPENDKP